MAKRSKVELHSAGVIELLKDPGVLADLVERAERVLAAAQASSPVETGAYQEGLEVRSRIEGRAVARVVSTVPYGLKVEASTGHMARALNAAS